MKIFGRLKDLLLESAVYGFANVFTRLIQIFLVPIYTKIFTPADYGVISIVTTVSFVVGSLVVLQLDSSVFRWYVETDDEKDRKITFSSSFWCQIILSLFVTAALAAYITFFSITIPHEEAKIEIGGYLLMTFGGLFFSTFENLILILLRIERKKWTTMIVVIFSASLTIFLSILLVIVLDYGLYGFYLAILLGSLIKASIYFPFIRNWINPFNFRFARLKEMLVYSLPFVPAGLALWVVGLLDRFFLVEYAGTAETGLYHIANSIAGVTSIIVAGFLQAWSPFAFSIKDDEGAKNTYSAALRFFVAAGCAVSVIVSLFSPEILRLLTAPAYYPAFDVVGLLCLANILLGVYQIIGIGLALAKKTMPIFYGTVFAAIANIALNFILIPTYGRTGAAWATLFSALIIPVYLFFPAQRLYFIPYRIAGVLFIFALSLTVILTINQIPADAPYYLPVKIASLLIYLGAVFFLTGGFGKEKFFKADII